MIAPAHRADPPPEIKTAAPVDAGSGGIIRNAGSDFTSINYTNFDRSATFDFVLTRSRLDFYERALPSSEFVDYVRCNGISTAHIVGFIGGCAVLPITDCRNGRFDWADDGELAFVCEAYGSDGETVIDLVSWPIDRPAHVMTLFGRCAMLGAWAAENPATYYLGGVLDMHRTPLDWLKADCRGACVVTPHLAARVLLDLPGNVAARDQRHGRSLTNLMQSVVDCNRIVVPRSQERRAA